MPYAPDEENSTKRLLAISCSSFFPLQASHTPPKDIPKYGMTGRIPSERWLEPEQRTFNSSFHSVR